ncbi:transposase [uncultured Desulfovibrio sp.]|uniref:transposase n=1 Tax=uncultured Desulfovibrio sp. TaxID=167968 RepID=UPI00345C6039
MFLIWEKTEPHLPPAVKEAGAAEPTTNRRFVNAVFRVMRAGAPWRDPPPDPGGLERHPPTLHPLAR